MPQRSYNGGRTVDIHNHRLAASPEATSRQAELLKIPLNSQVVRHCLIISLPKSKETRLDPLLKIIPFQGSVEVIEAIDGATLPKTWPDNYHIQAGDFGCLLSHQKALMYARDRGYPCVLILEDDVTFVPDFNKKLDVCMAALPGNYDMLWLNGNDVYEKPSYPYNQYLKILNGSWGTFAYVIRNTVYQYFIDAFNEQTRSSDDFYQMNHDRFNSFKTSEKLVFHIGHNSDRVNINYESRKFL